MEISDHVFNLPSTKYPEIYSLCFSSCSQYAMLISHYLRISLLILEDFRYLVLFVLYYSSTFIFFPLIIVFLTNKLNR